MDGFGSPLVYKWQTGLLAGSYRHSVFRIKITRLKSEVSKFDKSIMYAGETGLRDNGAPTGPSG